MAHEDRHGTISENPSREAGWARAAYALVLLAILLVAAPVIHAMGAYGTPNVCQAIVPRSAELGRDVMHELESRHPLTFAAADLLTRLVSKDSLVVNIERTIASDVEQKYALHCGADKLQCVKSFSHCYAHYATSLAGRERLVQELADRYEDELSKLIDLEPRGRQ